MHLASADYFTNNFFLYCLYGVIINFIASKYIPRIILQEPIPVALY